MTTERRAQAETALTNEIGRVETSVTNQIERIETTLTNELRKSEARLDTKIDLPRGDMETLEVGPRASDDRMMIRLGVMMAALFGLMFAALRLTDTA